MIKTTLIGHASMLIQSNKTTILTDPVWFDYLWEGVNVLCPSIKLVISKVPPIDIHAVYPHRVHLSAKVRVFVDFLVDAVRRNSPVHITK